MREPRAVAEGLGAGDMPAALQDGANDHCIARDISSGIASGVFTTPTLFLQDDATRGPRGSRALAAALLAVG
jgi:hypothetical protein